jgi:cysteine desulfurase
MIAMGHIYLDYNATTPIHPAVSDAMQPFLRDHFGNPSSSHWFGLQARKAVDEARAQVAFLLQCSPEEIIFTSGGSESDNFAIAGYARKHRSRGNHIITSQVEHPAVLEICRVLETEGFEITYLPVNQLGRVRIQELENKLRPTTILVSIMQANNEVGTVQPIAEIASRVHERNIVVHTDAAQAVGKIPVDVPSLDADMITIAGHKLYAPKGIGALYVRRGIELQQLIVGAGHELGRRAGTENVIGIVGLGAACQIVGREMANRVPEMKRLRDLLERELLERLPQIRINAHETDRLPNTLSISFANLEANRLIAELQDIACSPGAACHSDKVSMSHVLEAMHVPVEYAMGTIRFSLGYGTSEPDVQNAIEIIVATVQRLRSR